MSKKNKLQAYSDNTKKHVSITYEEEELPSPDTLSKYQSINPKCVDFVIEYTKHEQNQRHILTSVRDKRQYTIARGSFWLNMMALISAFVLVLVFILLSAWLFYLKRTWEGVGSVIVSFISLLSIFIRRRAK